MIKIQVVSNGAIVDVDGAKDAYIYDAENLSGLVYLLWDIKEQLEPSYSKYNARTIRIEEVHGAGYKCKDKKCKICRR